MPDAPVADRRPPQRALRGLNPVLRPLVGSPAGRVLPPFAVLAFEGRRTGKAYRIVVSAHEAPGGGMLVFTPARWRLNFRGGHPVRVAHAGRWATGTGTLVEDPEGGAATPQAVLDGGTKPAAGRPVAAPGPTPRAG